MTSYIRMLEKIKYRYRMTLILAEDDWDIPCHYTKILFWHACQAVVVYNISYKELGMERNRFATDLGAAGSVLESQTRNRFKATIALKLFLHFTQTIDAAWFIGDRQRHVIMRKGGYGQIRTTAATRTTTISNTQLTEFDATPALTVLRPMSYIISYPLYLFSMETKLPMLSSRCYQACFWPALSLANLKAVLNASSRDFAGVRYGVNVLERSGGAEGLG